MLREFWGKIEKFADISTVFFLLHSGIVGMPIFTDAAPFFGCTAKNGGQDLNDKKIERIFRMAILFMDKTRPAWQNYFVHTCNQVSSIVLTR